jgi:DegV family protein with EDD domain
MVAVVTDSAANVPADLQSELGIAVAPLALRFGERTFRDGVDMVGGDFYERLVTDHEPASTSAPSPGEYLEAYERAGDSELVCVTLASGMSVSHKNAVLAAEHFAGQIMVVDSRSATIGEGFVALEAARAARAGRSLQEVASGAEAVALDVRVIGAIETFEFLQRSGRVGKLQAYAATKLDIKPVFRLEGGEIKPVGRPRTRGKALTRIVEDVVREVAGRPVHVGAFHARAEDAAGELLERIGAQCDVVERFMVEASPAIGAHTGPGLVGVAFFCD